MPLPETTSRWIELDGAANARTVVPRVLLRSDNLQDLSARDVRHLVDDHALEVVVDLRTGVEVRREGPGPLTAEPGVRREHHSLYPEEGHTDLDLPEGVLPWSNGHGDHMPDETPAVRAYAGYLRQRPDSIVGAIRTIARAEGAVLVHCAAGKDRTGVVVALALDAAGVRRDAIVADYLATAERIEALMARLVASETYRVELEGHDAQSHAPRPGTIERVLAILDADHGGPADWLLANGLAEEDIARLRARLGS